MKRNHSLLEYTKDNDTQVSKLGPSGPSCIISPGHMTKMAAMPIHGKSPLKIFSRIICQMTLKRGTQQKGQALQSLYK